MSGFKYECARCLKRPKTKSQIGFLSNVKNRFYVDIGKEWRVILEPKST